jgi:glycosyltransferase involved in cell wall biosynthesis
MTRLPISVIIPMADCERWMAAALDSIVRSDCADVAMLVVDDGSTDRSREIMARYGDARVRLMRHRSPMSCGRV